MAMNEADLMASSPLLEEDAPPSRYLLRSCFRLSNTGPLFQETALKLAAMSIRSPALSSPGIRM